NADVLIVGGGIAGVSLAGRLANSLAGKARVILLEREDELQYHATRRSAAVFIESYGTTDQVRAWNRESRPFFEKPSQPFQELVKPRPVLYVARGKNVGELDKLLAQSPHLVHEITPDEALKRMPVIRPGVFARFAEEASAMDIDVARLFQGFWSIADKGGVEMLTRHEVTSLSHGSAGWTAATRHGDFTAPILVNAAGGWAGKIGLMAGLGDRGLVPKRRTMMTFDPGIAVPSGTLVNDMGGRFYFKCDAGIVTWSRADQTRVEPSDVQPEESTISIIAERVKKVTTMEVKSIQKSWAGLRTFTPSEAPVVEFDRDGFFWLAGQGGFGIQTSPALSAHAAALITERL